MKKALFTFIFLCLHSIVFSQVNIEEIKKNVTENPQKYYYDYLEIFKTAPETLSQEQLNYIYYGNNYVDYGYDRLTFNQKSGKISKFAHNRISKKFAEKILLDALPLYEQNPLNKELLLCLSDLYKAKSEQEKSDFHYNQYQLLIKTIEKSGNGKLDNSAILVTSFQDLMLSVERFSIVFVPGLDFKEKVLPDGSWLYIFKNGIDLFFVRLVHHKDAFK